MKSHHHGRKQLNFILLIFLGCGAPLEEFYKQLKNYGYIAYTTPLQYAETGTLVGGNPNSLSIITHPETCFPSQINGEPTNLRFVDETTLPSTNQTIMIDASIQADLFKILQVGAPSIKAKVKIKEVSKIQLDFEGAHVEYMDAIALGNFYKNHMNMTCKNYLDKVGFIIQAIKVDKMKFQFYSLNAGQISLSVEKIQEFLDLSADINWSIEKNTTLVISTPKYIGYQLGSLRAQDNGLALYRATKTILNKFVFRPMNIFKEIKGKKKPFEESFEFKNPVAFKEKDLDANQLQGEEDIPEDPTSDDSSSPKDSPKDRKDF